MSLRFHEIAEGDHSILNPFSSAKLDLLADICRPQRGQRHLDLACGRGELLCRWARDHGTVGLGIDISEVFTAGARARVVEFGLEASVEVVLGEAGSHDTGSEPFDIVSCIGATWIGGGLTGTLELIRPKLVTDATVLIGEPYWIDPPPPEAGAALGASGDMFVDLVGTLDRFDSAGFELVEMVIADADDWDRYVASQWLTVDDWLRDNPTDPEADALRDWSAQARRSHMEYGRRFLGWGVFILRPRH
jgi:SAM-dependent methyltransferase